MNEPQPRIRQSTLYDEPVVCVHTHQIVLVLSMAEYKHYDRSTPDDPDGVRRDINRGVKWVYVTANGHTLSMPESHYDRLVMRGKLYRREQANAARERRDAERAEIQKTAMDWLARDEG